MESHASVPLTMPVASPADKVNAYGWKALAGSVIGFSMDGFDLLISDLEMPGNAELQLVSKIAERGDGVPVIILTGFPSVRSAVACIDLPVHAAYRHHGRRAGALAFEPGICPPSHFLGQPARHIPGYRVFAGAPQPVDQIHFLIELLVRQ